MAFASQRKLKNDWPKLWTEQPHCFEEFLEVGFAVHQDFSCVMTCGTLTENMKPSGVRDAQLLTVWADGQA
jgi:hypothetical protein